MRTTKGPICEGGSVRGARLSRVNRATALALPVRRRWFVELVRRWIAKLVALVVFAVSAPPPTFAELALDVLKEYEGAKAAATFAAAQIQIARLISNFGNVLVTQITEVLWLEYVIRERAKKDRKFYDD